MECDKCGKEVRFPRKYAIKTKTTLTYGVLAKYFCEVCYPASS